MMRFAFSFVALAALTACSPQVPNSAAGVGFGDYDSYEAQREAQLSGAPTPQTTVLPPESTGVPTADAATATTAPAAISPVAPARVASNNPDISDEQDFGAVSGRESIESDAARLAALREQYQVVEPTALPSRSGSGGPNIVEYALSSTNVPGQSVYRRSVLRVTDFNRNCVRYTSSDKAQEAFLKSGGPERDKLNLDPDGDGFACDWDPTPFRRAVGQ